MLKYISNFDSDMYNRYRHIQREIDLMFEGTPDINNIRAVMRGHFPPINAYQQDQTIWVYVFASGLDQNDVNVTIEGFVLTVSGERSLKENNDDYRVGTERFNGTFKRTVGLPEYVIPEQIEVVYQEGVLKIEIPCNPHDEAVKTVLLDGWRQSR